MRTSLPWKVRPGYCGSVSVAVTPFFASGRIHLRNIDEDAQRTDGGDVEDLLAASDGARAGRGGAAGGGDQLADVQIARGDDAVEGRLDALERLQLFEPMHVGLRGSHLGRCAPASCDTALSVSCCETAFCPIRPW